MFLTQWRPRAIGSFYESIPVRSGENYCLQQNSLSFFYVIPVNLLSVHDMPRRFLDKGRGTFASNLSETKWQ